MDSAPDSHLGKPGGSAHSPTAESSGRRVEGLDAARALAILGMLAVNVGPLDGSGITGKLLVLPHGRASLLFVLLAGIGYTLLTRRARQGGPVPWQQVLWRAVLLGLIGLSTQLLDHEIDVILTTYAALFVVALLFVRAPSWLLLAGTGAVTLAGPVLWLVMQSGGAEFDREPATVLDPPLQILVSTVASGPYPMLTWLAPFLFGMWLGRLRLGDRDVQLRLLTLGGVVAVAAEVLTRVLEAAVGPASEALGAERLISGGAHSQMPLWLVAGTAAGVFVLGLALLVQPALGGASWPLVATGQMALTVYVAHMVLLAVFVRPGPHTLIGGALTTVALALVLVVAATLWRHFVGRGPLEALLRWGPRRSHTAP
ncbi:DUF418 domain-containing protein [Pseudactinotalea sp. Z1739]|uniref:DUF418 domain-containing protein n=1 Tax=Pseudactinotalea sp. Z1739 TaxID=3413028 RepID=UPI003C7D8236